MSRRQTNRSKLKKKRETSSNIAVNIDVEKDVKAVGTAENTIVVGGPNTPNRLDISTQQDLLNLDYQSSFCTQTQDGGVEVTWDWHSPGRKTIGTNGKNIKTHEAFCSGTPKRTKNIHKKRISNSPLMYKPLKRKLIKKENTDDIDKFKAELIALSEKIKNGQDERQLSTNELEENSKIDIPGEIDFDEFSNDENDLVISINSEELSTQDRRKENKNFDDLFDDSLNDTMIKCSQEIEERLNIGPVNYKRRKENTKVRSNSYTSLTNITENKFSSNSSSNSVQYSSIVRHNSDSINPKIKSHSSTSSMTSEKITKTLSDAVSSTPIKNTRKANLNLQKELNIPDDSFDEFLATCEEDFSQSDINFTSTKSSRYGKVYDNVHSMSPKKHSSSNIPNKLPSSVPLNIMKHLSKDNAIKLDNPNNVVAQSNEMILHTDSNCNRNWKFFKSKSHSDSSFANNDTNNACTSFKSTNQIGHRNICKDGSNSNLNSKSSSSGYSSSSVSTKHQIAPMLRTTSCLDSSVMTKKSVQKINIHNIQINHVNRCGVKEDGSVNRKNGAIHNTRDVASGMQSLQLCGPEEIKRKRMEAKMKLAAKKKRDKIRINSNDISSSVPLTAQNNRSR